MDAKTRAEVERKAKLGIPLAGDGRGHVGADALALWQQLMTAKQTARQDDLANQQTGSGVGTPSRSVIPTTFPGNTVIPDNTETAVKGYGFTAIVAVGVAFIGMSLLSSFRRARGR